MAMDLAELDPKLPENNTQPGIFELIRQETLKKMGKLSKEAMIQKALQKAVFIRDADFAMPAYDPTAEEEMPPLPTPLHESHQNNIENGDTSLVNGNCGNTNGNNGCTSDLPFCRLGCICQSVSCQDMYDEHYEKHCRDTGDPECMYGCICENPGPHLNGESKWITSKPYKYKRQRARDDEDCGFVPVHMREQMKEGRPKRKAQAPTRYRPDFNISEKELRAYENGNSNGSSNGMSKRTSRPRRRLCEQEEDDDDRSEDSDERIINDKKRMNTSDEMDPSPTPKKGRPTKQQSARNLREPSKRERKPRNFDLPEEEPRKRSIKKANGVIKSPSPIKREIKETPQQVQEIMSISQASLGTKLLVISVQSASRTCQGMYAVLRSTSDIITFVSWDDGFNTRAYLQELKYKFTSSRQTNAFFKEGNDLLFLPYVKTEDTIWLFYSIKKNFTNWDTIMSPELHAVIQSDLLLETIEKYKEEAVKKKSSMLVDIIHLNMNFNDDLRCRGRYLYLFFGKHGDVYLFGTPPPFYIEKNIHKPQTASNALIRPRYRARRPKSKPKAPLPPPPPAAAVVSVAPPKVDTPVEDVDVVKEVKDC